jgi:N-acetylglutamate synthase-like GNAT family acetyltransferase
VIDLDALAESARNRGLKLVRSRIRTEGKRGFGKVGLSEPGGKAVLGLDGKVPSATPEEVEEYLRNLGASDWGASLDQPMPPRKRKPAQKASPEAPKPPPPPPKPMVREARPADTAALTTLIRSLGADIDEKTVRKNLATLKNAGEASLVAVEGKDVVALCGIHRMTALHRDVPLGRINLLVVADHAQGRGIGRMLVTAAEERLRALGCEEIEITSNDRLTEAHAFYRHLGFERTSMRFIRKL